MDAAAQDDRRRRVPSSKWLPSNDVVFVHSAARVADVTYVNRDYRATHLWQHSITLAAIAANEPTGNLLAITAALTTHDLDQSA
jgi:hypothetical protein